MKRSFALEDFPFRTLALLLIALCAVFIPAAMAQSSVSVKVETAHGAMVTDVKVMTRRIEPETKHKGETNKTKPPAKAIAEQLSETDSGRYEIDHLQKGKYRFYACDDFLTYEPDFNDLDLGETDHKKFTLVLQEQPTIAAPVPKEVVSSDSKVCLIHDETGCFAIKGVDHIGNVSYRGVQDHYHVDYVQACKKE